MIFVLGRLLFVLTIVIILYCLFPKKFRPFVLLLSSYLLVYLVSGKMLFYLLVSTFSIHHFGIWLLYDKNYGKRELNIDNEVLSIKQKSKRKGILFLGIAVQVFLLLSLKYMGFFESCFNKLLFYMNVDFKFPISNIIAPIGISFYTLQSISYLVDCYNGKITPDTNIFRLALYLTFFPQLIMGPVSRYEHTAKSLFAGERLQWKNVLFGLERIIYGLIKKIIIANRLSVFTQTIFLHYEMYHGGIILVSLIIYVIYLYMNFSGIIDVVIGIGEIFGIKLPEEFQQPFFAKNLLDLCKRCRITICNWFYDYMYVPLVNSKFINKFHKKKLVSYIAFSIILLAICCSGGLWLGAKVKYIFLGLYIFVVALLEDILSKFIGLFRKSKDLKKNNFFIKISKIVKTNIVILFGALFYGANGLISGFLMLKKIFTTFRFDHIFDHLIYQINGLNQYDFIIIIISIVFIFVIDIFHELNISIREKLYKHKAVYSIGYILLIFYLVICGVIVEGNKSNEVKIDHIYTSANKVMFVAHPDDDILFGGNALYHEKYLVVCMTCGSVPERTKEFQKVMELTGDDYIMLGYPDLVNNKRSQWEEEWDSINKDVEKIIRSKNWHLIVTHNPDGEYGHFHHKKTNQVVTKYSNHDILHYFGKFYWKDIPNEDGLYKLSPDELYIKDKILLPVYRSQYYPILNLKNMRSYESWITYNDWVKNEK